MADTYYVRVTDDCGRLIDCVRLVRRNGNSPPLLILLLDADLDRFGFEIQEVELPNEQNDK